MRKPFYKKSHQSWYFQDHSGKQIRLGPDKTEAFKEYHRLMAGDLPVSGRTTVAELVDRFLVWIRENRAPKTYDWYFHHCNRFVIYVGPKMRFTELRAYHVTKWLTTFGGGDTYKNGACRAVTRAFNWAKKQGLVSSNPISGMERPAAKSREHFLTLEQWAALLALVPKGDFRDLICFLWETGARPQEARLAFAENYIDGRLILDRIDSKGKKDRRVIRLNTRAQKIVERRIKKQGQGPIFRTRYGRAWAARSLQCRFTKLSEKLGYKVLPYTLRHSWITHALLRGVDPLTVGILAGHKDATMVMRVYSHLAQNEEFLAEKLRQATA